MTECWYYFDTKNKDLTIRGHVNEDSTSNSLAFNNVILDGLSWAEFDTIVNALTEKGNVGIDKIVVDEEAKEA